MSYHSLCLGMQSLIQQKKTQQKTQNTLTWKHWRDTWLSSFKATRISEDFWTLHSFFKLGFPVFFHVLCAPTCSVITVTRDICICKTPPLGRCTRWNITDLSGFMFGAFSALTKREIRGRPNRTWTSQIEGQWTHRAFNVDTYCSKQKDSICSFDVMKPQLESNEGIKQQTAAHSHSGNVSFQLTECRSHDSPHWLPVIRVPARSLGCRSIADVWHFVLNPFRFRLFSHFQCYRHVWARSTRREETPWQHHDLLLTRTDLWSGERH